MNVLDLSRWQFGITTVYHFLFVPITIGLGFLVAGFEAAWLRTGRERWLRLTHFYGKLFLINFALGVVTGIVQEFQFGMNWSAYSRLVGNIFGAPLAIEALLAFFLESTFLGLWIFGWDRLPPKVHNACMWLAAAGTLLSAYFILAANAWMQHPVGYAYNPKTHQDVLPSTISPAFSLTVASAASADATLKVMTVVAIIFLPLVLAYQAWTYWVFRKRITAPPQSGAVPPRRPASGPAPKAPERVW